MQSKYTSYTTRYRKLMQRTQSYKAFFMMMRSLQTFVLIGFFCYSIFIYIN